MDLFFSAVVIGLGLYAAFILLPFIFAALALAVAGVVALIAHIFGKGN